MDKKDHLIFQFSEKDIERIARLLNITQAEMEKKHLHHLNDAVFIFLHDLKNPVKLIEEEAESQLSNIEELLDKLYKAFSSLNSNAEMRLSDSWHGSELYNLFYKDSQIAYADDAFYEQVDPVVQLGSIDRHNNEKDNHCIIIVQNLIMNIKEWVTVAGEKVIDIENAVIEADNAVAKAKKATEKNDKVTKTEKAVSKEKKRGPKERIELKNFILDLAYIYKDATGQEPTGAIRSVDGQSDSGKFFFFVKELLIITNQYTTDSSLENNIGRILRQRYRPKSYFITHDQWAQIKLLINNQSGQSNPRSRGPRRPRDTVNGIIFKLQTGKPWKELPKKKYPSTSTCQNWYRKWMASGIFDEIAKILNLKQPSKG